MAEVRLTHLRGRRALRLSRVIVFVQSVMILLLLVAMSEDYSHNQYLQAWASAHIGGFAFLLNGTLAAFYAGLIIGYYLRKPVEAKDERLPPRREELPLAAENTSRQAYTGERGSKESKVTW